MKTIDDIIPDLIDLTQRDKLQWSSLPQTPSTMAGTPFREIFKASISSEFDVEVWSQHDSNIDSPVLVAALKKDGQQIDRTSADRFAASYPTLARLHDAARRNAGRVGASIDQVLKLLAGMKR